MLVVYRLPNLLDFRTIELEPAELFGDCQDRVRSFQHDPGTESGKLLHVAEAVEVEPATQEVRNAMLRTLDADR